MGLDITGIGGVAEFGKGILDFVQGFFPKKMSQAEEAQAVLSLQNMIQSRDAVRDQATMKIIEAEMAQGDAYTKRARPTVVYAGLAFIFLVHVFIPLITYIAVVAGRALPEGMPTLSLPGDFWWAWGGVCSVWVLGRSAEKRGARSNLVDSITGSGAGFGGLLKPKK